MYLSHGSQENFLCSDDYRVNGYGIWRGPGKKDQGKEDMVKKGNSEQSVKEQWTR